jgi:type IV pilus assembly protein PilV
MMVQPVMLSNNKGFSLVEMVIAMVIILVSLLGLVQATLLSIDSNVSNMFRDEAIRIAEEQMNILKSLPVSDTNLPTGTTCANSVTPPITSPVTRNFRNITKTYAVCATITNLLPAPGDSKKSIQVAVGWDHKKENPPKGVTNREYEYSITSVVVNPL